MPFSISTKENGNTSEIDLLLSFCKIYMYLGEIVQRLVLKRKHLYPRNDSSYNINQHAKNFCSTRDGLKGYAGTFTNIYGRWNPWTLVRFSRDTGISWMGFGTIT